MSAQGPFIPETSTQEWLAPTKLSAGYAPPQGLPAGLPMYELRPLSTSEVLDRTFSLYRSKFWLFAGIACFMSILQSLVAGLQMLIQTRTLHSLGQLPGAGRAPAMPAGTGLSVILLAVASVVLFLSASVTLAACVFAMGETYLGRATTIKESFRATIGRWYAYLGIALWQLGSFMWPSMAFIVPGFILIALTRFAGGGAFAVIGAILLFLGFSGGLVLGFIFGLRNAFGVPIAVLERREVRPAMRRSKFLTNGTKWRILVIFLITWALFAVVGVLQMPLAFVTAMLLVKGGHAYITQALTLVINFVGYTVVTPVAMIGNTLLYFDQRVRKEAFDVEFLLGEERALEVNAPVQPFPDAHSAPPPQVPDAPSI